MVCKSVQFDTKFGFVDDNNMPLLMLFLLMLLVLLSVGFKLQLRLELGEDERLNTYNVESLSGILKLFLRQ
jgi:hypothetical protein